MEFDCNCIFNNCSIYRWMVYRWVLLSIIYLVPWCGVNSHVWIEAESLTRVIGCLICVKLANSWFLDSRILGIWNRIGLTCPSFSNCHQIQCREDAKTGLSSRIHSRLPPTSVPLYDRATVSYYEQLIDLSYPTTMR